MDNKIYYDELIKRYLYLYENKELVLSLCIRRINNDKKIKTDISLYEQLDKRVRLSDSKMIKSTIRNLKRRIGKEDYYLCFNVSKKITDAFEEFLFTDDIMENTVLFKHVEALKSNELYYESVIDMIDSLNDRRSKSNLLSKMPTFTVWKILNYVRENNQENPVVLNALDKYYNIDRTMLTGLNWESGYKLLEGEVNNENLSLFPDITLIYGIPGSYAVFNYIPNAYEFEDNFFESNSELDEVILDGKSKSIFMDILSRLSNLSSEDKLNIYNSYNCDKKLILE